MADRRKGTQNIGDGTQDSDKQFLEKNNVHGIMRDLLTKVVANRPDDPIKFIANYFETLTVSDECADLINRAVQVLSLTQYSRPMFETNILAAFDILSTYKINKKLQGINGTVLSLLLNALCKNISSVVMIRLFKRLECSEHEAVVYDIFRSSVFTCCVLQEYVTVTEKLFHSLDVQKTGKADKNLCESALDQLRSAVQSSQTDVTRILETSYSLSPDGLCTALDKAMSGKHSQGFYTQDQFVIEACDLFLNKVKRLK